MKPGEAYNLRWEDVDQISKHVNITPEEKQPPNPTTKQQTNGNATETQPKKKATSSRPLY